MLYANGVPDLVGTFDFDSVGVMWEDGSANGNYFGNKYQKVRDPQCNAIAASLQPLCSLQAIEDTSGNMVFQNPLPGKRGSFGRSNLSAPGTWTADMAFSKHIRVTEGTSFSLRVDATNIFNHPQASFGSFASGVRIIVPNPPDVGINSANPFGYLDNKVGTRTFQATLRFDF